MPENILQKIFRRVQISDSEGAVLNAILVKANIYGKHAQIAYPCIAGMTGFSERHVMRLIKSLECERRLLRVDRRRLWPGQNAINVYHVVVPWRQERAFQSRGFGRNYPGQDRVNNKGDRRCHPNGLTDIQIASNLARLCTEQEASSWLTPGTPPWYFAQGLEPPAEEEKKDSKNGC
jgi:hypothetical protein